MRGLFRFAIVTLLAAFSFPAISHAKTGSGPTPIGQVDTGSLQPRAERSDTSSPAPTAGPSLGELAAREQQAKQLADFRGGGVYIYAGSGALLVVVIVLLVLLI